MSILLHGKVYAFDLDGTLCHTPNGNEYAKSTPIKYRIIRVNQLHAAGHTIIIYTARGCKSGCTPELRALTKQQLKDWGVSYATLVMGQKIFYDQLIDDKAISDIQWEKEEGVGQPGIIAGSFELMHPGYIKQFNDVAAMMPHIIVALHENNGKRKQLMTVEERTEMLLSLRQVDKVIPYKTEKDLLELLKKNCPHVRILGNDYIGRDYTGMELGQAVHFVNRDHGWSTSKLINKLRGNTKNEGNRNRRRRVHRKSRS